jgi:hypothetical protein
MIFYALNVPLDRQAVVSKNIIAVSIWHACSARQYGLCNKRLFVLHHNYRLCCGTITGVICEDNMAAARSIKKKRSNSMFCAYELAAKLTTHLHLEAEPLKQLPLAVCDTRTSQAMYAFPSAATGRWVLNQKATEASMFMAHWLLTHHRGLLSSDVCHALSTSLHVCAHFVKMPPAQHAKHASLARHVVKGSAQAGAVQGWLA